MCHTTHFSHTTEHSHFACIKRQLSCLPLSFAAGIGFRNTHEYLRLKTVTLVPELVHDPVAEKKLPVVPPHVISMDELGFICDNPVMSICKEDNSVIS